MSVAAGELCRTRSSRFRLRRTNKPQFDTQQCVSDEWDAIEMEDGVLDFDWSRHIQSRHFRAGKHIIGSVSDQEGGVSRLIINRRRAVLLII